jgi:hypothetical protein
MSTRMTLLLSMILILLVGVLGPEQEALMAIETTDHHQWMINRWKGNEGKLRELIPILKSDPEWHKSSEYRDLMDALEPPPTWLASWEAKKDLSGADLRSVDLRGALLSGADLRLSNFTNANLDGADLSKAILINADLTNADLNHTNLSEADLWGANLSKASFYRANLSNASLFQAKLIEASLIEANLSGASLQEADLSNAYLSDANLSKSKLIFANVSQATLNNSNLSEADLEGANLDMAYMWSADMSSVVFEIRPASLPNFPSFITAKNLSSMTFKESPHALVELREAFKQSGLRNKEREITFAIEHGKRVKAWKQGIFGKLESIFKWLFFEVTCKYGLSPGRPLIIILSLILIFTLPYTLAVATQGKDGIWKVWPTDTIQVDVVRSNPEQITKGGIRAVRIGFYFSLLSAFNIGWRDFNVGEWIARIQPRDYTLRPTGWVRTVSGIQSLISLYLLALWLLVYFGRPFQLQ